MISIEQQAIHNSRSNSTSAFIVFSQLDIIIIRTFRRRAGINTTKASQIIIIIVVMSSAVA